MLWGVGNRCDPGPKSQHFQDERLKAPPVIFLLPAPTCLEMMHQVILLNPRYFAGAEEFAELVHAQRPPFAVLVGPDLLPVNRRCV